MSDYVIRPREPNEIDDRLREDIAALAELAAFGVEVDGQVQVAESTWVVYGHTSYDGEIVVGRYESAVEASVVLHAAGPRVPDHDGPFP